MQVRPAIAFVRPVALSLVAVAIVAACGGGGASTPSSRASGSPSRSAPASQPVLSAEPSATDIAFLDPTVTPAATPLIRVTGTNSKDSVRFRLVAGSYRVAWTISTTAARGCSQITVLRTPDGKVSDEVATKTLTAAGSEKGEDHVTIAVSATYYLSVVSTCKWALSILPE